MEEKVRFLQSVIKKHFGKYMSGSKFLLDLGCGNFDVIYKFLPMFDKVVGVDTEPRYFDEQRYVSKYLNNETVNVEYFEADLEVTPLETIYNKFGIPDFITMMDFIEHLPKHIIWPTITKSKASVMIYCPDAATFPKEVYNTKYKNKLNGKRPDGTLVKNFIHRSDWYVSDFEKFGYEIVYIKGWYSEKGGSGILAFKEREE